MSTTMQEATTDSTESNPHGRHRGNPSSQEEPESSPHGRHRRDAED
ncbi:hypothetical protein ABZO31_09270 [Streptomyces sp. HUAS MG47]